MTDTWVYEEVERQVTAWWNKDESVPPVGMLAECCLRAGLAHQAEAVCELRAVLEEIYVSIPGSYNDRDPMVMRHAKALNAIPALLACYPEEPSQRGTT